MSKRPFSFRAYTWQQFKKKKTALFSLYIILMLAITALFSPFIANHHPLYVKVNGQRLFPAFSQTFTNNQVDTLRSASGEFKVILYNQIDWRVAEIESIFWPPIAYSPNFTDKYNRDYVGPFSYQRIKQANGKMGKMPIYLRHWMGTDKMGRDVASILVHGSKVSLLVGLFAMLVAALIGIPLGAIAGYFGDFGITTSRIQYWLGLLGAILGVFFGFISRSYSIHQAFENSLMNGFIHLLVALLVAIASGIIFWWMGQFLHFIPFFKKRVHVPIDAFVSRSIEILNSLPTLILIITIAAVINERSLLVLVLIIGLTSWTGMARFMRAEMLRIKELEYIQSAKALGFGNARIIFRHALPNGLAPVFTAAAFGIASAILIESGLSFLGIGVPDEVITWGKLLSSGKEEFEASWLVIFPGLAIFFTVTAYNLVGEGLRDALDPKLKS